MEPNHTAMAIETHALTKIYHHGHPAREVAALRSIDLHVPRNSIFGFIGPNGAGKTTTIKLLLGLAQPTAGSAAIFGHDIVRESLAVRRRIGYLPQTPRFPDYMSARQVVRFKARFFHAGSEKAIENRVAEALDLTGLAGKADRPIKGFSGGEMQRLGIAQAQVNDPDLLVLDEPAAGLDPLGRRDVLAVMKRLRERTTIFYSTHILDDVEQVSDQVAVMQRGRLIAQAPLAELLAGRAAKRYTVRLRGDTRAARIRLGAEEWVSTIQAHEEKGETVWDVEVMDDEAARALLLRIVLEDPGLQVLSFNGVQLRLEDVFVDLVGGAGNGG